ncbi:MAG: hypothetical protein QW051_00300 [Candidatus Aenigmatarchaeota archaeon]
MFKMRKAILFVFAMIFVALLIARASADVCNCNSCSSCTNALNNASCTEVRLTTNITNYSGTCINNPISFNNKIFNCQNYFLIGNISAYGSYGIYLNNKQNNTILGCGFKNFERGLFLANSLNNTIIEARFEWYEWSEFSDSVTRYGIYLSNSSKNNFSITEIYFDINRFCDYCTVGESCAVFLNKSDNNSFFFAPNMILIDNDCGGAFCSVLKTYGILLNNSQNNTFTNFYVYGSSYAGGTPPLNIGLVEEFFGVYSMNSQNNTFLSGKIKDVRDGNFAMVRDGYGFYLNNSSTNILRDNNISLLTGVKGVGFYLVNSINNTLINNTINNSNKAMSKYGVYLVNSINNFIENNSLNENKFIYLSNSSFFYNNYIRNTYENLEVIIYNTTIYNNIFLINKDLKFSTTNSLLYNNLFKAKNIVDNSYESAFNTTLQDGDRIAGLKGYITEIGGNYWTNWTNNSYSDTCIDLNCDGFCDEPFVKDGIIDYLPLTGECYLNSSYSYETLEGGKENYEIDFIVKEIEEFKVENLYFHYKTKRTRITSPNITEQFQEEGINYSRIKLNHTHTIPQIENESNSQEIVNFAIEVKQTNQTVFRNFTQIVHKIWLSTTPTGNLTNLIYQLKLKDRNTKNDVRANISGIIKLYSIDGVFIRDFTLSVTDTTLKLYAPNITNASNNMTFYLKTKVSSIENSSYYTERDYICLKADPDNPTNRTLYIYPENQSLTKVFFNIKDKNQRSYKDAYITIEELTPQGYFLVGSRKADVYGSANKYVFEDLKHRINITDPSKCEFSHSKELLLQCKEIPCVFDIIASPTDKFVETIKDYNFRYSFNYDKESKKAIFYYDASEIVGGFNSIKFYITHKNILNETLVCERNSISVIDQFECELNYSSEYDAWFEVKTNDGKTIKEKITLSDIANRFGVEGLIWGALVIIALFMVGIWNPVVAVGTSVVGVVMLSIFGFIILPYLAIITLVTIAVIMLIKLKT